MQNLDNIFTTDSINQYLSYASTATFYLFVVLGIALLLEIYLNYRKKKYATNPNKKSHTKVSLAKSKKHTVASNIQQDTTIDGNPTSTYIKFMGKQKFYTYKITELFNCCLSSFFLFLLCIIRYNFFKKLDTIFSSLWIIFALLFTGVILKIIGLFIKSKKQVCDLKNQPKSHFSKNPILILFTVLDNFILLLSITISAGLIASQIPIVDITKFFGISTNRFTLIDLPFIISGIFVFSSCISVVLQRVLFLLNMTRTMHENITDMIKVFIPLIITLSFSLYIDINYSLIIVLCLGILSKYITEKFSTILFRHTSRKYGLNTSTPRGFLSILAPISNTLFSSMLDLAVTTALVFTSINYGGFYAMIISILGITSSIVLTSNTDIITKSSDTYKYIAKTILNIACFYIFFETLEFIYKTSVRINIFTPNVIIGLFISGIFIVFNTLKLVNLTRYINMNTSRTYIAIRSTIYIMLFCLCLYYLLPYINYEILASVVLGLILTTATISIISVNATDIMTRIINARQKSMQKDMKPAQIQQSQINLCRDTQLLHIGSILRNCILPLINDVATIIIIITLLLLPLIK